MYSISIFDSKLLQSISIHLFNIKNIFPLFFPNIVNQRRAMV